jgi:hypothetical protein
MMNIAGRRAKVFSAPDLDQKEAAPHSFLGMDPRQIHNKLSGFPVGRTFNP